ncbi:MAG: hypothetical protein N2606_02690 [Candidatus Omnitrophica bacterium]|nr:hypothetical protein [Candidatus Omnitrophota bacterium]
MFVTIKVLFNSNKKLIFLGLLIFCSINKFTAKAETGIEPSTPIENVIFVKKVIAGSSADKAGLKEKDIIITFANHKLSGNNSSLLEQEFIWLINSLPDSTYSMEILREAQKRTLQVVLNNSDNSVRLGIEFEVLENNPQKYFDYAIDLLREASKREDFISAVDNFEKAKALSPNWPQIYYNLAILYSKLDYYQNAIDNLTKYRQLITEQGLFQEEDVSKLIEQNIQKKQMLEDIKKRKMIKGKWLLLKKIPESKISGKLEPFPRFEIDNSEKMYLKNPLFSLKLSGKDAALIKRNIDNFERIPVYFDGRYFESRWLELYQAQEDNRIYFWPSFIFIKGEINYESYPRVIIRIKEFIQNKLDFIYYTSNFEDAVKQASQAFKNIVFDEDKDFRYEYYFEIN